MKTAKTKHDAAQDSSGAMLVLRRKFLERCTAKLNRIVSVLDDIVAFRSAAKTEQVDLGLDEMLRLAHELVGGGGTFGFPTISTIAAELETYVACCRAAGDQFDERVIMRFGDRLTSKVVEYACAEH